MAHRHHTGLVNHSFKSGITIAASLHALAAIPGGEMFEYCMSESPLRHELTHQRFELADGYVTVPEGPGLGVTIDENTVAKYRVA
jgi:L-alanine-DL-glutamate epimerase-like enolase superfamily enzyme